MIFTEKKITINNDQCKIDSPVVLYRGDYNVEVRFTIVSSPYKYSNKQETNVTESTEASFGQLIINVPNSKPIFSDVTPVESDGAIIFTIKKEMIDESIELGEYDFQIRLFDENQKSRATIPPVIQGIKIKEPIAIENGTNVAQVNYGSTSTSTPLDSFDSDGNYIETSWKDRDLITDSKLNKIEKALTGINNKAKDIEGSIPTKTSQLTNDSGYVTDTEMRTAIENKDTIYDSRMTNIETKNTEQDSRLDVAENRLANIGNDITNTMQPIIDEHTSRLDAIEAIDVAQNSRLDVIEAKNQQQDDRLLDIEKTNKRQDMDLKCLFTEAKNNMMDIAEEGNNINLQNSTEGHVLIDELKGNTLVNCNKEPDKELILNGNINTQGYRNVTLTEGVDGGLVDVALEGNTMVNVCDQKDPVAITKLYTVETGNHVALQGEYDGKCRPVVTGNTLVNLINYKDITWSASRWNNFILLKNLIQPLKTSTVYTLIIDIANYSFNKPFWIGLDTNNNSTLFLSNNEGNFYISGNGRYVLKVYTKDDFTNLNNVFYTIHDPNEYTGACVATVSILEGDYTNKPIPEYFEGLQSSFEDKVVTQEMVDAGEELAENLGKYKVDYVISREDGTVGQTKTFYLNSPLLEGDTIEQQGNNVVHVHRSELRAYETDDELTLPTDKTNTLVAKATPQYEVISQNDTILCDSYVNGHLDVDSVVPIERVGFLPFEEELTYLYPSTQYAVQFVSDAVNKVDITLGGAKLLNQDVVVGTNKYMVTTPGELIDNDLVLNGEGFNASNIVVTQATDKDFGYFEGMKSVGECEGNVIEILSRYGNLINYIRDPHASKPIYYFSSDELNKLKPYLIYFNLVDSYIYCNNLFDYYYISEGTDIWLNLGTYDKHKALEVLNRRVAEGMNKSNTQQLTHEPLRAVGNVKDRYVLIDGKWYIERKCGYRNNYSICDAWSNENLTNRRLKLFKLDNSIEEFNDINILRKVKSNKFKCVQYGYTDGRFNVPFLAYITENGNLWVSADINYTQQDMLNYINDCQFVYELQTPTYESIDYNPLEVYSSTTHITTNSTIPANIIVKNHGFNCLLKPSTTYTISSNLGLNTVTTPSTPTEDCLRFMDTDTSDVTTMKDVLVLEGDWTTKSDLIPANFIGMESAFEQELVTDENDEHYGKYKVNAKVTNEDKTKENNITFYLNEPLRGIEDVKDRVYVKDDKVVVERNCGIRAYEDGDFGTYLTDLVNTVYQLAEPTYEEVEYNDTKLFIESFKNSTLFYNSNVPVTSKLYYSYSVPLVDKVAQTADISDQQDQLIIDMATQCAIMEMMLM